LDFGVVRSGFGKDRPGKDRPGISCRRRRESRMIEDFGNFIPFEAEARPNVKSCNAKDDPSTP
jgi:hypothetical protein